MQVWVAGRCVGDLNIAVPNGYRAHEIHMVDDDDEADLWDQDGMFQPAAVKRLALPITRRSVAVDELDVARDSEYLRQLSRARRIPEDATMERDPVGMRYIFRWPVFELDLDTYEKVFDLDNFEPL